MTLDEAKKLSPEEINKTISLALGWKLVNEKCPFGDFPDVVIDSWVSPEGEESKYPDYFHDLNACHEATKSLTPNEEEGYHYKIGDQIHRHVMIDAPANVRSIALACVLSERKKWLFSLGSRLGIREGK